MRRERLVLMLTFAVLVVAAGPATAYQTVSGTVSGTWAVDTYHVTGDLIIADNSTLNISAGSVIKFDPEVGMVVRGRVNSNGSDGSEVIFTSRDDDTVGDTIATSNGAPDAGDWNEIYVNGTGSYQN